MSTLANIWKTAAARNLEDLPLTEDARDLAQATYYTGAKVASDPDRVNSEVWESMEQQFLDADVAPYFVTNTLQALFTQGVAAFHLLLRQAPEGEEREQKFYDLAFEADRFLVEYQQRHSTEH